MRTVITRVTELNQRKFNKTAFFPFHFAVFQRNILFEGSLDKKEYPAKTPKAKTPEDYKIVNRGKMGSFVQDICGDPEFINYSEITGNVTQILKDCETSKPGGNSNANPSFMNTTMSAIWFCSVYMINLGKHAQVLVALENICLKKLMNKINS